MTGLQLRRILFPFLIFAILIWFPFSGNGQSNLTPVILESAALTIVGSTNVNKFTCELFKHHLNDTLKYVSGTTDEAAIFNGLVLKFNVSDFACTNNMMTKDFKELLKEDAFPYILMNINEVTVHTTSESTESKTVSANIVLHIAGVAKREYIDEAHIKSSDQGLRLSGSHNFLMSTFKIEPPTKLFGTIRTEDAIEILFSIGLK